MNKETEKSTSFYKLVQPFPEIRAIAPQKTGFLSANLQFIIPGLDIGNRDKKSVSAIAKSCGSNVYDAQFERCENRGTKERATLVEIAFYVQEPINGNSMKEIRREGRLLLERFMGIISFYAGIKCSYINVQTNLIQSNGQICKTLDVKHLVEASKIEFELPDEPFAGKNPSEKIFSALFWLRRGLAQKDCIETYASLMVCLQCIAREVISLPAEFKKCDKCDYKYRKDPSITELVRVLVTEKLGGDKQLFDRIWKARNKIVAHGNETISADVFLELTELKFEAAEFCYKGIKLAMGITDQDKPCIDRNFYISPDVMYLD